MRFTLFPFTLCVVTLITAWPATGQIPDRLLVAEPLEDRELKLEGHKLVAINAGRTDTSHSTCLHVPSIGLIVGGDTVYNGIHPYLGETDRQSRFNAA